MNLSFRDLSTLGKLYIIFLTFMVVVGTIYMLIVMDVDRKSDEYPVDKLSIYSSKGVLFKVRKLLFIGIKSLNYIGTITLISNL